MKNEKNIKGASVKRCSKCGVVKGVELFAKRRCQCKECIKKRKKEYREKNKEHRNERDREYYEKNKVKIYNKKFNLNTAPPELKPALKGLIELRNKNKFIKEIKDA